MKQNSSNTDEIFLAAFFSGERYASADTGLQIGVSLDGKTFGNISKEKKPIFLPRHGVRDPHILYRRNHWYMVYSYGSDISPVVIIAKSKDLFHLEEVIVLRMAEDNPSGNNYVDVPSWVVDSNGSVHIIGCIDYNHHWVTRRPVCDNPDHWGKPDAWLPPVEMTDINGGALIQGNSSVIQKDGVFYMAYNTHLDHVMNMRTSKHIDREWSAPRRNNIYCEKDKSESENLLIMGNGAFRFYVSGSNSFQYKLWYVTSGDLGYTWTEPTYLEFTGFDHRVNWAQVIRITEPKAITFLTESFLLH